MEHSISSQEVGYTGWLHFSKLLELYTYGFSVSLYVRISSTKYEAQLTERAWEDGAGPMMLIEEGPCTPR